MDEKRAHAVFRAEHRHATLQCERVRRDRFIDYQSNKYMMHDVRLIAAGMSTVVMYLYLHTGSVFISLAEYSKSSFHFRRRRVYAFVLKLETISVLQFLAVFIILGIGVDDVFVFYDAFEDVQSRRRARGYALESLKLCL